jgi:dihydrofolate reductase
MSPAKLTIVVAVANNGVIGHNNTLPWHLPADLRHFKITTMGKPILMGRKTHESIGRALPGRLNIVLTTQHDYVAEGCRVVRSIDEAIGIVESEGGDEVMVIGGAKLYEEALPRADRIHLTRVHADIAGDTWFPELEASDWTEIASEQRQADTDNAHACTFVTLVRRVPESSS